MIYTKNARTYLTMAMNEDKFKKEFILAMKEKLELNIQPKKDNLYEKVIDENLKGP